MKEYNLNIAGYHISFESSANGPDLVPSVRFQRNISQDAEYDVKIRVHSGPFHLPENFEKVFHAPYVEEINGIAIHSKTNFWSIWKNADELYISTIFPDSASGKDAVLKFSLSDKNWELWVNDDEKEIDPFEYPLDGLILYYLTVINGDIMVHASGINYEGKGYIFSGISGRGKSTIAGLWDGYGARVIHDDRLIIRKRGYEYRIFNTPVYNNDEPDECSLNKIFLIEHGSENRMVPLKGASAVSLVMANCIQHTWSAHIIHKLLDSVSDLCSSVPVCRLYFIPDNSIIDYILENEK